MACPEFIEGENMKLPKLYAFDKKLETDLSLSENPLGCSPRVFTALKKTFSDITEYPDPRSEKLNEAFSRKFSIPKEKITFGNGSETLIDLICRTLINPGNEVIIPEVSFPLFEIATTLAGGRPIFARMTKNLGIDLQALKRKITKKTKIIFICNPNNPTGKVLNRKAILDFVKEVTPVLVVMDEANIEFGGKSVISDVRNFDNLIVLRTFSKAFGLAGLRIGVLIGPKKFVKKVNKIKQPFPLNTFAEKAALTAFNDDEFIRKSRQFINEQRKFLSKELKKRGFKVFNSQANNILVGMNRLFPNATKFVQLLNGNNVSVVNGNSFRGLNDQFFRLSPRLPETNQKFLKVVDKILMEKKP